MGSAQLLQPILATFTRHAPSKATPLNKLPTDDETGLDRHCWRAPEFCSLALACHQRDAMALGLMVTSAIRCQRITPPTHMPGANSATTAPQKVLEARSEQDEWL